MKKTSKVVNAAVAKPEGAAPSSISPSSVRPLIFISHDHRDSALAEHFANLLTDASGGTVKSFRSSARKTGAGIEFGSEWYSEIMSKIDDASDVVALLTSNSIDRPWILFEAGFAKAKLGRPVFGVVVGVAIDQAVKGPFAQFQNSLDDEDSLTKLVIQLIKRNPEAEPREQAVRKQVAVFRDVVASEAPAPSTKLPTKSATEAADAAKLFEEVKLLFREFSVSIDAQMARRQGQGEPRFRVNERVLEAIIDESPDLPSAILMVASLFRDELPWMYEAGIDLSRAIQTRNRQRIDATFIRFRNLASMSERSSVVKYLTHDSNLRYHVRAMLQFVSSVAQRLEMDLEPLTHFKGRTSSKKSATDESN